MTDIATEIREAANRLRQHLTDQQIDVAFIHVGIQKRVILVYLKSIGNDIPVTWEGYDVLKYEAEPQTIEGL